MGRGPQSFRALWKPRNGRPMHTDLFGPASPWRFILLKCTLKQSNITYKFCTMEVGSFCRRQDVARSDAGGDFRFRGSRPQQRPRTQKIYLTKRAADLTPTPLLVRLGCGAADCDIYFFSFARDILIWMAGVGILPLCDLYLGFLSRFSVHEKSGVKNCSKIKEVDEHSNNFNTSRQKKKKKIIFKTFVCCVSPLSCLPLSRYFCRNHRWQRLRFAAFSFRLNPSWLLQD